MAPNTAVIYVPADIELDLRQPHLGHPSRPALLGELFTPGSSRPFHEGVLQCPQCRDMNPDCPEWMFLRRGKNGLLHAVHHNPGIRDHADGESDAHKALKERIATAARNGGLQAAIESIGADRKRRTDVLVSGGVRDLACEAQISYATKENVLRRSKKAWKDKLTPLWATTNLTAPLVGIAPWAGLQRMHWQQFLDRSELPVIAGVRDLSWERCTRGRLCPDKAKGRPCSGWNHVWLAGRMRNLDDLIVRSAYGEMVPYESRTSRNVANWFWVRTSDAAQVDDTPDVRPPRQRKPAQPDDDRVLDRTCSYDQDSDTRPETPAHVEAPIIVSVRRPPSVEPPPAAANTPTPERGHEVPAQSYRAKVINPGTLPVETARETAAAANVDVFLTAVRARAVEIDTVPIKRRVAGLAGEAVRDPGADQDGRFGWMLPFSDGRVVRLLMPGTDLHLVRDDLTASAPCLRVNGTAWWWNDAVGQVAAEGMILDLHEPGRS